MKPSGCAAFLARVTRVMSLCALAALAAPATPALGAFPGQNGRIAYDDFGNVRTVNPDGSGAAQLTTFPDGGTSPEWSPDGRRIVFGSERGGLGGQVYVMNADGSGQTRLTDPPGRSGVPAWSADGRQIVFTRDGDLWLMAADGTGETRLTSLAGTELRADWSPDGSRIAFERDNQLWSIRPDGSDLLSVTGPPAFPVVRYGAPDWAPDGSRLVYLAESIADAEICTSIEAIGAEGGARTEVVPATCAGGAVSNFYADPAWSPDGARIASGDEFSLFTVRVDGSDIQSVPGDGVTTDWQAITGPRREDYKNPAQFCKAEREQLGREAFEERYGSFPDCKRGG